MMDLRSFAAMAGLASLLGGQPIDTQPKPHHFHPRHRADKRAGRPIHQPGTTYCRPGRAQYKRRQKLQRIARRWSGTKPGQRGESAPREYP